MNFKIENVGNNACVFTPYNSEFVQKLKMIGGAKWDSAKKCWIVPVTAVDTVRRHMRDIYGMDDTADENSVRVRLTFHEEYYETRQPVAFFGHVIARAFGRDSGARPGDDVIFISGGCKSGGSMKNWDSIVTEGSVVEIGSVPLALYEKYEDELPRGITSEIVAAEPRVDRNDLIAEKTRLEARIREIEKMLNEMGN